MYLNILLLPCVPDERINQVTPRYPDYKNLHSAPIDTSRGNIPQSQHFAPFPLQPLGAKGCITKSTLFHVPALRMLPKNIGYPCSLPIHSPSMANVSAPRARNDVGL